MQPPAVRSVFCSLPRLAAAPLFRVWALALAALVVALPGTSSALSISIAEGATEADPINVTAVGWDSCSPACSFTAAGESTSVVTHVQFRDSLPVPSSYSWVGYLLEDATSRLISDSLSISAVLSANISGRHQWTFTYSFASDNETGSLGTLAPEVSGLVEDGTLQNLAPYLTTVSGGLAWADFVSATGFPIDVSLQSDVTEVPEPASLALLGLGLAGLGFIRHKKV